MLQHLSIRNLATVDALEIEFAQGMTAITGETGAGKSIILGALGLTLGDRGDKSMVRPGADKAEIIAEFNTARIATVQPWLEAHELVAEEDANLCLLRRVITGEGRSRAYINGSTVTLANLRTLGEMLLDIHSQHEHQSLLKKQTHQRLLDEFAVPESLLDDLQATWKAWRQNHQQLTALRERVEENSAAAQLLAYQLNELDELALGDNEVAELEDEFASLSHAEELLNGVNQALSGLSETDEGSALALVHQIQSALAKLPGQTVGVVSACELLATARIQLEEAADELRRFRDGFEADPERLEAINKRLARLHELARKHRVKPAELPALINSLRADLDGLDSSGSELERFAANDRSLRERYRELAGKVSAQRQSGAKQLAKAVNQQLQALSMPHAKLDIELTPAPADAPLQTGLEAVEFLVSTNPGQPSQPLGKIASGGELSRISLAIQVCTARTSQVPSLVFDEVDVGIGGGVALVVGELLRTLGQTTQVLCVTHQAQVAGQAHHHFKVSKHTDRKSTATRITPLRGDEVVREVARMLGGERYSDESLAHAQQMVAEN